MSQWECACASILATELHPAHCDFLRWSVVLAIFEPTSYALVELSFSRGSSLSCINSRERIFSGRAQEFMVQRRNNGGCILTNGRKIETNSFEYVFYLIMEVSIIKNCGHITTKIDTANKNCCSCCIVNLEKLISHLFLLVFVQTRMSGVWARYNKLLEAQPLLTKALTSLTGFTLGDVLAQNFINEDDKPYDFMRTARLGSFGFLLHGTTGHYFYGFLDSKMPGTKPVTVASKVAIDQFFWNPIFGLMFFGFLNATEGKTFEEYKKKIQADLQTAVMGSWAVWIPAHTINFAFVPPSQRLLYINSIQIGYNVFLSFLGNKKVEDDEKKE